MAGASVDNAEASSDALPMRLHHTAYVTRDQQATRAFYEDLIGLPLVATWKELDPAGDGGERAYVHTFFGLADGSALAFFQFADPEDQARMGPEIPFTPAVHVALKVTAETQAAIAGRLAAAGWKPEATSLHDHGYCQSLYTRDPNGLLLEFTVDADGVDEDAPARRARARAELEGWLAGDRASNNTYR